MTIDEAVRMVQAMDEICGGVWLEATVLILERHLPEVPWRKLLPEDP